MKQRILLLLGVLAVLVGFGFVLPALAKLRAIGCLPGPDIRFLVLGVLMVAAGPTAGLCAWRTKSGKL
jgi:hypothetical protein